MLASLRFTRDQLSAPLVTDPGPAFQQFMFELLRRELRQLHAFPARGKDGSIDLVAKGPKCTFIECKYSEDMRPPSNVWTAIDRKLNECLSPDKPQSGQRQYHPWYITGDARVRRYWLCTTTSFVNERERAEAVEQMRRTFDSVGSRSGLGHLRDVEVDVLDWEDIKARLTSRPDLMFRWFPATRPAGIKALDEEERGSFREFLSGTILPYHSRRAFWRTAAAERSSPTEDELVDELLAGDDVTGIVITGKGGAGKTRLMLELGRLAADRYWIVLRATERVTRPDIERVLENAPRHLRLVILFDYLELVTNFGDVAEYIEEVNASAAHTVRYVANCRTGWYRNVEAFGNHRRVEISDETDRTSVAYRTSVVRAILAEASIANDEHLLVCRDIPVLAVFMLFLVSSGREADLAELVTERDFGRWLAKRVQQSFGHPVDRALACLFTLFPLTDAHIQQFDERPRSLTERLIADGWLERNEVARRSSWTTIHDAVADRVVVAFLTTLHSAVHLFVEDVITAGERLGLLNSVLISLQRIGEHLLHIPWEQVLRRRIETNPAAWAGARAVFLRSSLLSPIERARVLSVGPTSWHSSFDAALVSFVAEGCKAISQNPAVHDDADLDTIRSWVVKVFDSGSADAYMVRQALKTFGATLSHLGEAFIRNRPTDRRTHFVIEAWLDQVGDAQRVRASVETWLSVNAYTAEAQFVYRAWMDAGGDMNVIDTQFRRWIVNYAGVDGADFAMRSWIQRGGDFEVVRDAAFACLAHNTANPEATYLLHAITEQKTLPALVVADVLRWCCNHPTDDDALWRLTRLRKNLLLPELNQLVVTTVSCVLAQWLDDATELTRFAATEGLVLVGNLSTIADKSPGVREQCEDVIIRWLRLPQAFVLAEPLLMLQRPAFVRYVDDLVARGRLTGDDAPYLKSFSTWVGQWHEEWRARIAPIPAWLTM